MTAKPHWAPDYPTYEDIVNSWGYETVSFDTTGSYQGDHEVLLRDQAGRWGIAVFGYGSCSGCDSLEAVVPWGGDDDWSGLVQLAAELRDGVEWFDTPAAALAWLDRQMDRDTGTNWWNYDDEVVEVMTKYRDVISSSNQ